MQERKEAYIWYLGGEDPLKKGMAAHFSILAWKIPWLEEPGGLQPVHVVAESRTQWGSWACTMYMDYLGQFGTDAEGGGAQNVTRGL